MSNILSIGAQCNTIWQLLGLLINAILLSFIAVLVYKAITFLGDKILQFCKIRIDIAKGDLHSKIRLDR